MFSKQEKKVAEEQLISSTNTIGKGTSLKGDVETYGNIRIDGRIKGNIVTKSKLVLGNSSFVDGNVLAQNAELEGEVTGTVEVTELLVLKPTARVKGDIITNKMIVESGAEFNGSCKMGVDTKEIKISEANEKSESESESESKEETGTRFPETAEAKSA